MKFLTKKAEELKEKDLFIFRDSPEIELMRINNITESKDTMICDVVVSDLNLLFGINKEVKVITVE